MSADPLSLLLDGRFPDPDGGGHLPAPATQVVIADSLAGQEAALVEALGFGRHLAVVSDVTTHRVLAARVEEALRRHFQVEQVVLPEHPHPDLETAERVQAASGRAAALVAVGSGTINDLCKFASARAGIPFAVFASAPSMNGYTSINAAITVQGHKKTLPAQAAAGVFLDLEVLASAPPRLIRAGLGDSLCRCTAQADWLLAHLLLQRPYREAPFALLAADEQALLAAPEALLAGDLDAIARLARTLVLSGFGMTLCGGSEPASQGEHLISHYVDMMADPAWPSSFHGEQIGVTTLTMAGLQARMLDGAPPRLSASTLTGEDLGRHFGPALGRSCWCEIEGKLLDAGRAAELNDRLTRDWEALRARIDAVRRPPAELLEVLERAGAASAPAALGWPDGFYREAVRHARLIRDRYTFLDLAADAGRLDVAIGGV